MLLGEPIMVSSSTVCYSIFLITPSVELPTELLEEIFLEAWLDIPLFDSADRWSLFSTLSLVNHRFRVLALWAAIRHVRVLSHSSGDVVAYRSIGQQYLALQHVPRGAPSPQAEQEQLLKGVFQNSTVHLDVTYAAHTTWKTSDLWLKDDICPKRPDEAHPVLYRDTDGPWGEYIDDHASTRKEKHRDWLAHRRRDRLSGWFATLLAAVPDCAALVLEAYPGEPFGITTYAALLEAFWWWTSLAAVHFRVAPWYPDFVEESTGLRRGPLPPLPELKAVRRVWLDPLPGCTCKQLEGMVPVRVHAEECTMRRMLEPFPGLRGREDVVVPFGVEVRKRGDEAAGQTLELVGPARDTSGEAAVKEVKPRMLPGLNLLGTDTLWELVDPVSSFFC